MGKENNRDRDNRTKIPPVVEDFALYTFKEFKKETVIMSDKKELQRSYYNMLFDLSPEAIMWSARFGHINEPRIKKINDGIYGKFVDPHFLSFATKMVKDIGIKRITEYRAFPLIAANILKVISEQNEIRKSEGQPLIETKDIEKLCKVCFGKNWKKLTKIGLDDDVAFNILMAYPHKSCLDGDVTRNKTYRIKQFFDAIYTMAKSVEIPFELIIDAIVPEEQYAAFVAFAMLEKKSRFANMTSSQQKLYTTITKWCLEWLEGADGDERNAVLRVYISNRQKDIAADKDAPRRYPLTSLSKDEYPAIVTTINTLLAADANNKQYLD